MAKRQGIRRIDSSEVMGEGSYVKFSPIIYGRAKSAFGQKSDDDTENADLVIGLIVDALQEWDWVDFDDNPLPLPTTSAELEDMLTINEVQFLTREIVGNSESAKN